MNAVTVAVHQISRRDVESADLHWFAKIDNVRIEMRDAPSGRKTLDLCRRD